MSLGDLRKWWDSGEGMLLANPALVGDPGLGRSILSDGEVGFATSGTTGEPKIVVHTRDSLEVSARMVLAHLGAVGGERWLRALPAFHVGGFGVEVRAWLLGVEASVLEGGWDALRFSRMVARESVAWSSLVPAQLADLVAAGERAPDCLRGIVVGGGVLGRGLAERARNLGWPVLESFGMTEAGSQVATGLPDDPVGAGLHRLDGWELRTDSASGVLELRGAALASGYLVRDGEPRSGHEGGKWRRVPLPGKEGWFRSSDRVALEEGGSRLRWLGRVDSLVKILGELVSLDALQAELAAMADKTGDPGDSLVIVDAGTARDRVLVLVAEAGAGSDEALEELVERWNAGRPGIERLARIIRRETLPRSPLGKVLLHKLREELSQAVLPE